MRHRRPDPFDLPGIYEGPDLIPLSPDPVREWQRYIADLKKDRTYYEDKKTRAAFDREIEYSKERLRVAEAQLRRN
ncbi:MAG: hypothetical protein F4Y71_05885 [Acidobacteria bacterium]|nr:hypothetical protein [Acidobacteriota bacterium]MYG75278.1 hypothetical protein [Acidobacteriota bacterium]